MILIEIRGKVFNPYQITAIIDNESYVVLSFTNDFLILFENVTPNVLAAEINAAIYDHEYFLEQKRLEARNHSQTQWRNN